MHKPLFFKHCIIIYGLLIFSFPPSLFSNPERDDKFIPVYGQTLNIGISEAILTLDPQKAFDPGSRITANAVSETLYRRLASGEVEPQLATDLPRLIAPGIYRIELRAQTKFHNGELLTPQDVIFTFNRLKDPTLKLPTSSLYENISYITSADETHLDFAYTQSRDMLIDCLSRAEAVILSEKMVSSLGRAYGMAGVLGTGPFSLKDWQKKDKLVLEKYPSYWANTIQNTESHQAGNELTSKSGADSRAQARPTPEKRPDLKPRPFLGKVSITYLQDQDALAKRLSQGLIDIAIGLDFKHFVQFARRKTTLFTSTHDSHTLVQLYLNRKTAPFDDVRLRKMLSWAVDRTDLVSRAFFGWGQPSRSPLLPQTDVAIPESVRAVCSHQPQKAAQILNELGYDQDNQLRFTVIFTDCPHLQKIAALLAEQWQKIGLNVTFKPLNKKNLFDAVYNRSGTHITWHAALEDWRDWRRLSEATEFLKLQYSSTSPYNKTGFASAEVDQLFDTVTRANKAQILPLILKNIMDDCATIPLASPSLLVAYSTRIQNLTWSTEGIPYLDNCWKTESVPELYDTEE
ncbi:ABC transporter substrate-binding protein [candidate division CSSED10-310 bacterium]|uniref:ABC transporter substrate-binding protein n=1 Tax=candidate division CSSED10-310 bacterium TaxID=2855610 RepID=A0ABV6YR25_UNCC1